MQLKISTANSRKSRQWNNKIIDWGDFVRKCADTTRTPETLTEYLNYPKDRQSDIKDVGGFVGGHLIDGSAGRTKNNIALRSCLTLDVDNAPADLWGKFKDVYHGAAVCYSTHKHTSENPRLRIIIPFSRDVEPDEYQPISRRFCKDTQLIEYVDSTTHDLNRLFYWPSTSKGADFYYRRQGGDALDVDGVLQSYDDWRDCTQWPTAEAETDKVHNAAAKAQDPLTKGGVIGAFCRTYPMPDAIEKFLSDVYEPCETAGGSRYTYKEGSTSGGAVVYDNKFLYSHHGTDPVGGELLNAFDLVRLHKFGHLDSNAKAETPINRLPSYLKMCDLCINDKNTKLRLMDEKQLSSVEDFADISTDDNDWRAELQTDRKGNTLNNLNNLRLIILKDEVFKRVKYNLFARGDTTDAPELVSDNEPDKFDDEQLGKIALRIEAKYGLTVNKNKVADMLTSTATERGFNPVKDFITATQWDGKKRVETLLTRYLGAADTPANREITRKWIVAAVARVFKPGCTFQNVLTLTGPQSIGKSVFLRTLVGDTNAFCDTLCAADNDARRNEATRGAWIVEIAELNGMSRAEWQALKGYISRDEDRWRPAYMRLRTDAGRQYVFAATTNATDFLREADKGNRRWWIVPVLGTGEVKDWIGKLSAEVPQIWAEAYQYYIGGEDFCNLTRDTAEYMAQKQWEYSEDADDPMPGKIDAYINVLLPSDWDTRTPEARRNYILNPDELVGTVRCDKICAVAYLFEQEGVRLRDNGYKTAAMRFNAIMKRKSDEWEPKDRIYFPGYGRQRGYIRRPIDDEDDL